jgi:hypothetical protein
MTNSEIEDNGGYWGEVPPPMDPPNRSDRHWVDQNPMLATVVHTLESAPIIAVDVEFVSARPTDTSTMPRLALIQIADANRCYVLDALRLTDLSPLRSLFANPTVLKIFHGVGSDLRVLGSRDLEVIHTLDLEAVSRSIFGSRESGLQAMLQRACDIRLDKTLQRSDWTHRPLPSAMFVYAARDAEMTLTLYTWLNEHYRWAIDLFEVFAEEPSLNSIVAPWLEPFLQGERNFPSELLDPTSGLPNEHELTRDCLEAWNNIRRPIWRARILRTAADLALAGIIPLAIVALNAQPAEERAAAVRALGRIRATEAEPQIKKMITDAVPDVRRAAQNALDQIFLPPRIGRFARSDAGIDVSAEEDISADTPWKSKLRGLIPPDPSSD